MKTITTLLFTLLVCFSNAQNWTAVGKEVVNFNDIFRQNIKLYQFDNKLFAGGYFREISGVTAHAVAYYDGWQWHAMNFEGPIPLAIKSFISYDGKLYGFAEYVFSNIMDNFILELDQSTNTWRPLPGAEVSTVFQISQKSIRDMVEYKGELYVLGNFDFIGDVEARNLARWDGTQWRSVVGVGEESLESSFLEKMYVFQDELYIVGTRLYLSNNPFLRSEVAKWDGTQFVFPDGGLIVPAGNFFFNPKTMVEYKGELYIGSDIEGLTTDPLLTGYTLYKWNGERWESVRGFDLTNGIVKGIAALAVFADDLYISSYNGEFFVFNGEELIRLEERFSGQMTSFEIYNNNLYCAGSNFGGLKPDGVFRLSKKIPGYTERISLFPNPSRGSFNLKYYQITSGDTKITFTDVQGKLIFKRTYENEEGAYFKNFNFEHLPAGVYFLNIEINGHQETKKVLFVE